MNFDENMTSKSQIVLHKGKVSIFFLVNIFSTYATFVWTISDMLDQIYANVTPGPPKPSKLFLPSQFTLPLGTERYMVEGMGAVLIPVSAGDQLTLVNDEGAQVCEVVAAGQGGKIDPKILDVPANGTAAGLQTLLIGDDQSLRGLRMGLEARGIDLHDAAALRLFGSDTVAKAEETLRVIRDGRVIIATPGTPMDAEQQDITTPITVMVKRAVIKKHVGFELPDPLADSIDDIRVHSATAEAYFVKAGDYIQILDVDGRQCADFECFSARKLDGHQKRLPALIAPAVAAFDPDKECPRS